MTTLFSDPETAHYLQNLRTKKPVYENLFDTFGELLEAQAYLTRTYTNIPSWTPEVDHTRLTTGGFILAGVSLAPLRSQMEDAAQALLPIMRMKLPFSTELSQIEDAIASKDLDIVELAEAVISHNEYVFEKAGAALEIRSTTLFYATRATMAPVVAAMTNRMNTQLASLEWSQGTCAVCGMPPAVATLSRRDDDRLEHLVGGGGAHHLHCSLCSHEWRFVRGKCPSCGNDDHEQREVLSAETARHERVEVCHKCSSYLVCVDLRALEEDPLIPALPLGLIHLDLLAQKRNLHPVGPTPWNTL